MKAKRKLPVLHKNYMMRKNVIAKLEMQFNKYLRKSSLMIFLENSGSCNMYHPLKIAIAPLLS